MAKVIRSHLDPRQSYLQIALNGTLDDAKEIISILPRSERIIVEAGTPFIKRYGEFGIAQIHEWYRQHTIGTDIRTAQAFGDMSARELLGALMKQSPVPISPALSPRAPYIVADLKTMDRAETEVAMAARAGARAAIALGLAPVETLNTFIDSCETYGLDAMIDMMNVEYPLAILQKLRKIPPVIIIHRGVDEEKFNKEKQIPLHEIRRIKGMYDVMISIAGGDTIREVQRAVFNDADIVVIWKSVFTNTKETRALVEEFLSEVK